MSENTGEANKKVSRRDFLKKAVTVAGITASGITLAASSLNAVEKDAVENGISSGSGIFFPLYETHYKGIEADRIPDDLDVLFRELAGSNLLVASVKSIFEGKISYYAKNDAENKLIQNPILKKIATNGTEIMMGDVEIPGIVGSKTFDYTSGNSIEGLAGLGLSLAILKDFLRKGTKSASGSITRRTFLRGVGLTGAAWLMEPSLYDLSRGGPWIGKFNTERENVLNRIIDKINGVTSSAHPEIAGHFFRNLVIADKMLTVAEDLEQKTGRKAKIGFNVEYSHTGIEDFLRVGHDVCRWIIERYPTNVLKYIAELNGGGESLWTARLLKLPEDLSPGPNAQWDKVTDRKVVDVELQKALAPKLK